MSDVILELELEHGNITNVLDLLEDQLQRLQGGAPADRGLITLAVNYLRDFPEECHHPTEDLVFGMIRKRNPEKVADLVNLSQSHEELHELTNRVSEAIAREEWTPDFPALLAKYLGIYRDHIMREEREFFPAALATLTRDDFALLEYELFDRKDHLFDDATESRFDELKRGINERARGDSSCVQPEVNRNATDELTRLRRIDSVESFNETMREHDFRIRKYHSGGYSLESAGRWLVDIPECGEGRAAWCAYFYWRAINDRRAHR